MKYTQSKEYMISKSLLVTRVQLTAASRQLFSDQDFSYFQNISLNVNLLC